MDMLNANIVINSFFFFIYGYQHCFQQLSTDINKTGENDISTRLFI